MPGHSLQIEKLFFYPGWETDAIVKELLGERSSDMVVTVSKTNLDTDAFSPVAHSEPYCSNSVISAVIRCRVFPELCCGVERKLLLFSFSIK